MPRHYSGLTLLAGLAILFSGTSLRAQDVFHPDSQFGPYTYQATLIPGGGAGDEFGRRVALAGDVALVADTGFVYVFERNPSTDEWRETTPITPAVPVEMFGRSLAFDRNTAIVGSLGAAHLFRRNAEGQWQEVATLTPGDGHPNFGISVAIAGNQAIVGATGNDPNFGAAYVFRRDSGDSASWHEVAVLASPETTDAGRRTFGYSVAITRGAAIVAAGTGPAQGAATVFVGDAAAVDSWRPLRRLFVGAAFPGDVAIDREAAVFGFGEVSSGVYILGRDEGGPENWGIRTIYNPELACCGTVQRAQVDGDRIILGFGLGTAVHILSRNQGARNAWKRIASFGDADRNTPSAIDLGAGVAISGDTVLMGAARRGIASVSKGVFVVVSDLDGDGVRDGIDPCPRDPFNNVAGNCKRASEVHPILDDLITEGDVTTETQDGRQFITVTFTNTSTTAVKNPFFEVTTLTGGNVLLNADEGRGRIGATLSPDVGDGVLSAGESMTVTFRIRLRTNDPYQFFVAFHGDPLPQ